MAISFKFITTNLETQVILPQMLLVILSGLSWSQHSCLWNNEDSKD